MYFTIKAIHFSIFTGIIGHNPAREKEDKIEVKIKLEREAGACIECIGFQKITFRIKNPRLYPEINLELQVEVDGQVLIQTIIEQPAT